MANYAVIENNIVINIIVADTKNIAEEVTGKLCIEYTEEKPVGINYLFNGEKFTAPVVEEVVEEATE